MFVDVLKNRSSLKCPDIQRKIPILDSLFNEAAGVQTNNFIKMWLQQRCFPVNVANFLRTAFSIEHLRWLLLCLLEREEEESVEKRSEEKIFKWKKKMKIFHLTSTCKFWCYLKQKCKYNYVNVIELLTLFSLLFLQIFFLVVRACSLFVFSFLINSKISLVAFISIFRSRHWGLFRKIAVRQDIIKTVIFYKTGVCSQYSLLNK